MPTQTQDQAVIHRLAVDWFHKLDTHAPAEDYRSLLAGDALEMRFPEGIFRGFAGFHRWYERVLGIFFDEVHTIKQVEPVLGDGPDVTVKVVVHWEASTWTPPEPKSRRIKLDAYQTWVLSPQPAPGSFAIKTYIVDDLKYDPDSTRL